MSHQSTDSDKRDPSLRGRYLRWEGDHTLTGVGDDEEGPCPVCKATMRRVALASSKMRHHVVHDYALHQRKGAPHVGLPMSRKDEQMYREYGSWKERRKKEREKAARSKAASMKANAHHEPTESERRAKAAASRYVEEQTTSRESA